MNDDDFLAAVAACTLPPSLFDHRGHLRLAAILLQRHSLDQAVQRCCALILAYASHLGAADKFHWTTTEALARLLHAGALAGDARAGLALHYSPERLASDAARHHFVAPDRAPLPC